MRAIVFVFCLSCFLSRAASPAEPVVIDRMAVVVGNHVIKLSDIDREIRLTDFLNARPLTIAPESKKQAAERLIDQQIIRTELATGGYARATDSDAQALLKDIRQSRFGGSDARIRAALERYGLTQDQLQAQLLWQLTVLRFIEQRFRPGVLVADDEIRAYYDSHREELAKQFGKDASFEAVAPKIRETMEGERINKDFETWLDGARKRIRIEYREEGLK